MKKLLVVAGMSLLSAVTFAQTSFSGSWTLKNTNYINGPEYQNAFVGKIVVNQTKDSVIIESFSTGDDGKETKSRQGIPMNGKKVSSVSSATGRKLVRNLEWAADKKVVTYTTEIYQAANESEIELTRIDKWSLSPDGKQLFINRKSVETVSENWEATGEYSKE